MTVSTSPEPAKKPFTGKRKSGFSATWLALVVVLALCVYAYVVEFEGGKKKDAQKAKDAVALKFDVEHASSVEIASKGRILVLEKKPDGWKVTQPVQDSADGAAVASLLTSLSTERTQETVVEGDDFDKPKDGGKAALAKYGLSDYTGRITVKSTDGPSQALQTHDIKIGAKSFDSSLYAQVDGEKKVILVSSMWDLFIAKMPKDLRDKRLLRVDAADLLSDFDLITVTTTAKAGGQATAQLLKTVQLKKDAGKWTFLQPKTALFPISPDAVQTFLGQLKALRAEKGVFIIAIHTRVTYPTKNMIRHLD